MVTAHRVYTVDAEGCRTLNVGSLLAEHALWWRACDDGDAFILMPAVMGTLHGTSGRLPRSVVPSPVSRGSVSPKRDAGAPLRQPQRDSHR
jgi:hypothetical protein